MVHSPLLAILTGSSALGRSTVAGSQKSDQPENGM